MIKRMKANRALQVHNRNNLTRKKLGMIDYSKMKHKFNTDKFKPKSAEEMEVLRTKLKGEQRREKHVLILGLILIVVMVILTFLWLW